MLATLMFVAPAAEAADNEVAACVKKSNSPAPFVVDSKPPLITRIDACAEMPKAKREMAEQPIVGAFRQAPAGVVKCLILKFKGDSSMHMGFDFRLGFSSGAGSIRRSPDN